MTPTCSVPSGLMAHKPTLRNRYTLNEVLKSWPTCQWFRLVSLYRQQWQPGWEVLQGIRICYLKQEWFCVWSVLVRSGIKLTFFLVDGIVLCFEVRMRTMLLTYWCFSSHKAVFILSQGLLSFLCCPGNGGWASTKSWEGTQPGQLMQMSQRGASYCMKSCPVYKLGRAVQG